MAQQTINIGTVANDGTGDPLRDAFDKANDNFTELYAGLTGLLDFKGSTDCSANPNYPAASKGDFYLVSVAGMIGGASGIVVEAGDSFFATADNAGGTQASVGTSWTVVQGNITSYMPKTGGVFTGDIEVPAEAYDATGWNGNNEAPTKNDIRDKIEGIIAGVPSAYTDEMARDAIGAALVAGTNVTITVNDGADTITITVDRTPALQAVTSSATVTPTFSNDQVNITAQAAGLTLANPTGTAVDAWGLSIRIKDNGTARSITFGSQYRAMGVTLPTTTVISKTLYLGCVWNAADTKFDVVAVALEA
jgi:hypothetical protein